MRVRFAGCGDAFGSGGRWQTCIHLAADGQAMLVDCGTTGLLALKAQGPAPNAVRVVAGTHLHGDHFGGAVRDWRYHLDYPDAARPLAEIQAERVVLTHMSADMLSRLVDSALPAAYDGMVIDI
jgi:ribonuclease BN (tRNA processing enzyme)